MHSSAATPELDRVVPGITKVVYTSDDAVYDNAAEIAVEMLQLAGIRGTCKAFDEFGDDELTIEVDGVSFQEQISRDEPMPTIVSCVNQALKAKGATRRWTQFEDSGWQGEAGAILVDAAQFAAIDADDVGIFYGYTYDPSDPRD